MTFVIVIVIRLVRNNNDIVSSTLGQVLLASTNVNDFMNACI